VNPTDTQAVLTISLLAAFADGAKHERERAEIKRIAEGLSQADGVNLPTLYQDVLMKRVDLAGTVPRLQTTEARQLAYEMAVCVCDADGSQSDAERAFLADLRGALALEPVAAGRFTQAAEAIATTPFASTTATTTAVAATGAALTTAAAGTADGTARVANVSDAELDQTILNAAILNGALELLPESLATMAIIPLQMKLVYRIGQAHGYELDSGHVKDFIATLGVGLTSQYLEQAGRRLLGGLLGRVGGGLIGGLGRQAVSSGMSFATTYALGHVAKRYYQGGRSLSTQVLKDAYASVTQQAQGLQGRYLPAIQEKARTLDRTQLLNLVRNG
jgi:uncharacterized protein (DUF697 family)/tellurite resistance protein